MQTTPPDPSDRQGPDFHNRSTQMHPASTEATALSEQDSSKSNSTQLLSRVPVPPEVSPSVSRPWLYSAISGNGQLLVCFDETGSPAQMFYPHVDAGPHLHSFLIGIQLFPDEATGSSGSMQEVSWLAHPAWTHQLSSDEGTTTLRCVSLHPTLPVCIEQEMDVHYQQNVFINRITLTNLGSSSLYGKLVIYAGFDFDHRSSGNTCYFDSTTSMLVFFAHDRYASITCDRPVESFDCDQSTLNQQDKLFRQISQGRFEERSFALGQVRGGARYSLGELAPVQQTPCSLQIGFAPSLKGLRALSALLAQSQLSAETSRQWWRETYASAAFETTIQPIKTLYNRSLITLKLLTDSQTGGIIAAPECDPDFRSCGGYGFCWPRDGAFIASTLDAVGQHEHARAFYDWALRTQEEGGEWYQRYYVEKELAPTWGFVQFDEIGAVVWSICRHILLTKDTVYAQQAVAALSRACEYMQKELDAETGLAPVTKDLWEERDGISTYACACTWAGFNEFARLLFTLGRPMEAERWATVAGQLKSAIETYLWDESLQRFLRGIKTRISLSDFEQLRYKADFSAESVEEREGPENARYLLLRDATIDTSILGLSVPFGVFPADDPRMLATADAIAGHLTSPVGGIYRYQADNYRGGNPWILCTLWLALQDIASGQQARGYQLYTWALEHRTTLDLLAEQIDRSTGQPCWIMPLGWSHAMFLLASKACREHGLLK